VATIETYVSVGDLSISVSVVGGAFSVESKVGQVDAPVAVLTVLRPPASDVIPEIWQRELDSGDSGDERPSSSLHS
jgi:hypothetical protein